MTKTMRVVIHTSFQVGQVTLASLLANFLNKLYGIVFGHQSDFPGANCDNLTHSRTLG